MVHLNLELVLHFLYLQFLRQTEIFLSLQCVDIHHQVWRTSEVRGCRVARCLVTFGMRGFGFLPEPFIALIEQKIHIASADRIETLLRFVGIHCFPVRFVQRELVTLVFKTSLGNEAQDFGCVCEMVRTLLIRTLSDSHLIVFVSCNFILLGVGEKQTQCLALWEEVHAALFHQDFQCRHLIGLRFVRLKN